MIPKLYEEENEFDKENPLDKLSDFDYDWLPENGWDDDND